MSDYVEISPFLLELMKEFNAAYDNSDVMQAANGRTQYEMSIHNGNEVKITRKTVAPDGKSSCEDVTSDDITAWLRNARQSLGMRGTDQELRMEPCTIATIVRDASENYSPAAMQKLIANFAAVGHVQLADVQKAALLAKRLELLAIEMKGERVIAKNIRLSQALSHCMHNKKDDATQQTGLSLSPPEGVVLRQYVGAIRKALVDIMGGADAKAIEENGKVWISDATLAAAWDKVVNSHADVTELLSAIEPAFAAKGRAA